VFLRTLKNGGRNHRSSVLIEKRNSGNPFQDRLFKRWLSAGNFQGLKEITAVPPARRMPVLRLFSYSQASITVAYLKAGK